MKLKFGSILLLIALLGLSACSSETEEVASDDESTVVESGGEDSVPSDETTEEDHVADPQDGTGGQGNKGGNSAVEIDWSLVPEQTVFFDDEYTIGEMLEYAIQDEFAARHEYELIISEYGEISPFVSIMAAEESHIASLETVYNNNGYVIPQDESDTRVVLPASVTEALETGVQAEVNNIALYEAFLETEDLPDDIRSVFEMLKAGSESHLESFLQALQRQSTETTE